MAGAAWSALNTAAGVLLPLGMFAFFARVVSPAALGAVALALAGTELVKAAGAPGLYEALLQQRDAHRARCHEAAAAVLLLVGAALFLLFAALCGTVAAAAGAPAPYAVAAGVLGLRIPLDLVALQPQAALAQGLAFRRLALRSVVANGLAGAAGIAVALVGYPIAGMVAYLVGQSLVVLAATVLGTQALARPRLHRDALHRMRGQAGYATGVRLVAAMNNQFDQVVVAGLLGNERLAAYNLAKRVEGAFITASASFSGILFQPLFARSSPGEGGPVLAQALAVTTATSGLAAAFLAANRTEAVGLVFGPQWMEAAPLVALTALGGYLRALGGVHGAMLSVGGRNGTLLALAGVSAATGILVAAGASWYGLAGVAGLLALRNAGFVAAAAAATRQDARGTGAAYLLGVLLPFAAMLLGALAGRWTAGEVLPTLVPEGLLRTVLLLAVSGTAASACGLAALGLRLLQMLRAR